MKMTAEEYARRVKQVGPRSPLGSDCLWAFLSLIHISVGWPGPVTFQTVRLFCRSYQVMVSGSAFQVRALE